MFLLAAKSLHLGSAGKARSWSCRFDSRDRDEQSFLAESLFWLLMFKFVRKNISLFDWNSWGKNLGCLTAASTILKPLSFLLKSSIFQTMAPCLFRQRHFPEDQQFFRRPVNDVLALHGCLCLLLEVYLAVCVLSDNIRFLRGLFLMNRVISFPFCLPVYL